MLFQTLDNKQECYKIFCNDQLIDDYRGKDLTHTWAPSSHIQNPNIEYAQIWCHGKSLNEVCPDNLSSHWKLVNQKARTFIKTFHNAKINLDDVCFYDLVPEKFLLEFYDLKNKICKHVFENYHKPRNYEFLKDLSIFIKEIESRTLNIDQEQIDKVVSHLPAAQKLRECGLHVVYNQWRTATGRLATEKRSFPILTLSKELRHVIKPQNDLFVELDFNSAELRVLLGLLDKEQPCEDIHSWISKNIFDCRYDREETKKKTFAWLYNPKASNKKLNSYFDRDQIYEKYFLDGFVHTPYGRSLAVTPDKAVNYLIQSTSSDMLLNSAISINKELAKTKSFVSFCVHDSIVLDMSREDRLLIKKLAENFSRTKFGILKTNLSMGKNFGNMRKIS